MMAQNIDNSAARSFWFVGASYGGTNDQSSRFLNDGIWENANPKSLDDVKSMREGDRIAIKAAYTRKHGLPFDNRGNTVSVMAIKATGTITENLGDGKQVKVDWDPDSETREWYFYTYQRTVWRVLPGNWYADGLIAFAFDGVPQDLDRFRNDPYWKDRFGDQVSDKSRFGWTVFYEAIADKLLDYKDDRTSLVAFIHGLSYKVAGLSHLQDQFSDGTSGPLKDICPFTTLGLFNRGITDANRTILAKELGTFLGVEEQAPTAFDSIPILNNQKSWFFSYEKNRGTEDLDALWTVFSAALEYSDSEEPETRDRFAEAYDNATVILGVGWNLTMGLYWIRPWIFPTLDSQSRTYVQKKLGIQIGLNGPGKRCDATDYLALADSLKARFQEEDFPVHTFPEMSLAAWQFKDPSVAKEKDSGWQSILIGCIQDQCKKTGSYLFSSQDIHMCLDELQEQFPNNNTIKATISRQLQILRDHNKLRFVDNSGNYEWIGSKFLDADVEEVNDDIAPEDQAVSVPIVQYSIEDIIADGCFLEREQLKLMIERLRIKRNLILQGPPGTGKTWLAKRLAYALIGQKSDSKVRALQFHPNLSYEDFVRGWRPCGDGKLSLVDGPFLEMINAAKKDHTTGYVVVIEEINRGNPAQVFGEMLTLLEADKRTPAEALELCYRKEDGETVYIPKNLYVIGTMNIADRSLALVDLAFRRRFAFIDLEPKLGEKWRNWVNAKSGVDLGFLAQVEGRINKLNEQIKDDPGLGYQYRIGHSYVTPSSSDKITDSQEWFRQVVMTEIGPLLEEYWFDALTKAREARDNLVEGI